MAKHSRLKNSSKRCIYGGVTREESRRTIRRFRRQSCGRIAATNVKKGGKKSGGGDSTAKGKDWKLSFKTEWTARNTPQQNTKLETAFTVITAQARSMLIEAQIPDGEHFKLWQEAPVTTTFLNNLVWVTVNGETKTRWDYAGHKIPLWVKSLRTFGEAGTVK